MIRIACPLLLALLCSLGPFPRNIVRGDDAENDTAGLTTVPAAVETDSATAKYPDAEPAPAPDTEKMLADLQKRLEHLEQGKVPASASSSSPARDIPTDRWNVRLGGHVQLD
ncbi:MAG: hypothetical protein ACK57O_13915, partial [Planctomyces sp.]